MVVGVVFTVFAAHSPPPPGRPSHASPRFRVREANIAPPPPRVVLVAPPPPGGPAVRLRRALGLVCALTPLAPAGVPLEHGVPLHGTPPLPSAEAALGYCTGAHEAIGTKAQKENWLVSGLPLCHKSAAQRCLWQNRSSTSQTTAVQHWSPPPPPPNTHMQRVEARAHAPKIRFPPRLRTSNADVSIADLQFTTDIDGFGNELVQNRRSTPKRRSSIQLHMCSGPRPCGSVAHTNRAKPSRPARRRVRRRAPRGLRGGGDCGLPFWSAGHRPVNREPDPRAPFNTSAPLVWGVRPKL